MTRRYLTDKEKAEMVLAQQGRCACCGEKLQPPNIEFDHTVAGWLVDHKDKPDRAICATPCHRNKTRGDVKRIAKAKRLHRSWFGEQKPKRKTIASRPFDRRWRKRMDGSVVPREARP